MPGAALMGRPRKGTEKPPPTDDRVTIINLKGSPEYSKWLEDVYKKTHIPKATIIRLAVTLWAEQNGHSAPPEI